MRNTGKEADQNLYSATSISDQLSYQFENRVSSDPNTPFLFLSSIFIIGVAIFGTAWYYASSALDEEDALYGSGSWINSIYMTMQVVAVQGFYETPDKYGLRWINFFMLLFGLVIFAILVGFITDSVISFMTCMQEGKTRVMETNHTLILGWNETTARVVIQISLLRRQYQVRNESSYPILYYLPALVNIFDMLGLLERPSTSLANQDIVIMSEKSKEDIHALLNNAMVERGILPWRTKIGQNIICRVGDSTNVSDLLRVGVHTAAAIIVMQTEADREIEESSERAIQNGATVRTTLAIRYNILTSPFKQTGRINPDLRIIMQMQAPCRSIGSATFLSPDGRGVMYPLNLVQFLNALLFACISQPGLAKVLLKLLDFEGYAIRRRRAKNLRGGPNNRYGDCIGKTFKDIKTQYPNAIFIGIVRPSFSTTEEMTTANLGICCEPQTVIEEEDLILFIGQRSTPICKISAIKEAENFTDEAMLIYKQLSRDNKTRLKLKKHVLVCGWRSIWEKDDSALLKTRLKEASICMDADSSFNFINSVPAADFENFAINMGCTKVTTSETSGVEGEVHYRLFEPYSEMYMNHINGDAADYDTLESIISSRNISTAIVLGTQRDIHLSQSSMDTRVMTILLLLRTLAKNKEDQLPMHVIGENQEDATAKIALGPQLDLHNNNTSEIEYHPDFVNTQAIYARVLTMTAAFPSIAEAIQELFSWGGSENRGGVSLDIVRANMYVPLNKRISHGVAGALTELTEGEISIYLGYMVRGNEFINPDRNETIEFTTDHFLILLRR